jgi:hypothetical protein
MAQDSIDISGFEDSLFNEDFLSNSLNDIFGRFGNKIQNDLIKSLENGGHNATLRLQQSIELDVELFGQTGFSWQLKLADYYDDLDQGRKAGKEPPLQPILEWVKAKSVFGGLNVKDPTSTAFAIKKNIGKFGTQPTYWFTKVVEDGRLEELTKELSESIGRNIILKDGNN